MVGLFDSDTFSSIDKTPLANEIVPTKLSLKTKLNSYGRLDQLKVRICMRGDMLIKHGSNNSWSPTAFERLLKCIIADAVYNKTYICQLDIIYKHS